MGGIRKPSTELQVLEAGLGQVEDPYMLKDLLPFTLIELAELVRKQVRYSAFTMIRAGQVFMAIKKKLGHGEWEKFVIDQHWSWAYVRASMKLLEVAARFPQTLHIAPGRATDRMLHLPMAQIETLFEDMTPEAIKKLTPWDIERIYDAKRDELRKTHRTKKPIDPSILDQEKKEREEAEWAEFMDIYGAADKAIHKLSLVKIKPEWFDRIFKHLLIKKLGRTWDRMAKNINPVEEVLKRAEIVHVRGFAKGPRRES
jgi:hypothetical protein